MTEARKRKGQLTKKTHLLDPGDNDFTIDDDRYTACGLDADAYPAGTIPKYFLRKSGWEVRVVQSNPTCKQCARTVKPYGLRSRKPKRDKIITTHTPVIR